MRICPKCGAGMPDTAHTCVKCGYAFAQQPQSGAQSPRQVRYASSDAPKQSAPQQNIPQQNSVQPNLPHSPNGGQLRFSAPQQPPYGSTPTPSQQPPYASTPIPQQQPPYANAPIPQQSFTPNTVMMPAAKPKRRVPLWVKIGAPIVVAVLLFVGLSAAFTGGNSSMPEVHYEITAANGNASKIDALTTTGQVYSQTILIYLVGSDLESGEFGAATADLEEIQNANVDTTKNNILVYTGGAKRWHANIPTDRNMLYRLGENGFETVAESELLNMGDPNTLAEFIRYGLTNYNTDKYGLILWDHGGGPIHGYGVDEITGDWLDLAELEAALEAGTSAVGKTFEWIGFDACLMSSIEVADALAPYASYMIASQEAEPGYGWDYSFLDVLSQADMDGARLGKAIIDQYMAFYETAFTQGASEMSLTLSCIDLQKLSEAKESLRVLFDTVDASILDGDLAPVSRARDSAKGFGNFSSGTVTDLVDLQHLLTLLGETYEDAQTAQQSISDMIMYTATNTANANGISIYCPYGNMEQAQQVLQNFESLSFLEEYTKFARDFYETRANNTTSGNRSGASAKYTSKGDSGRFTVDLTAEQAANYARATFYILSKEPDSGEDAYAFILGSNNVTLDGNKLTAAFDNKAVYAVDNTTGEVSDRPIQLVETERVSETAHCYKTTAVLMKTVFGEDLSFESDVNTARLLFRVDESTGEVILQSAFPNSATGMYAGKQDLSIYDYETIDFVGQVCTATRDENGILLPYSEWNFTGQAVGTSLSMEKGFHFEWREIPDTENYVCQFRVEDIYGNIYTTELIPMEK